MSIYKKAATLGLKFFGKDTLLKYGFNFAPMYRRSTARIIEVTKDLLYIKIKLPLSYKNKNYVNSIFGGSMFAAVDPIPMVQLIYLLGDNYVIWDKKAEISFKKPARENLYAEFTYTQEELAEIKESIEKEHEIEIIKITQLTSKDQNTVYCEVQKTIYIADKQFYKTKMLQKQAETKSRDLGE